MKVQVPRKLQILLFPASNALLSILAFQAVSAAMPGVAQSLLVVLTMGEFYFGALLVRENITYPEKTIGPVQEMPPVMSDGKPIGRIVPIATDRIFPSDHVAVNLHTRDPRVKQWAREVVGGAALTQELWVKRRKMFGQHQYEKWVGGLCDRSVLKTKNKNGNRKGGFRVNGSEGWTYIQGLATGKEYLPIPSPDSDVSKNA